MPLLKKKALEKAPLPQYLRDDEEVFHCEMTNEIFRDYDEFAERTILCNSMVWTCSMTGKSNLTYTEAQVSEENARKNLRDFPVELRVPLLYVAVKTKRSAFGEMAEDVFLYMKDRYFVGENVEACFSSNKWREYHVLQVIAPSEEQIKNATRNGNSPVKHLNPAASLYKYDVELLDSDDQDISEKMLVEFSQIRRKKGTYSRERNKLFLKQYVEQNSDGFWTIKESVLEEFSVYKVMFDQIFDGPQPEFESSKKKQMNGKKVKQETLVKYLTKNGAVKSTSENSDLLKKMKKREMEFKQKKEDIKQKTAEQRLSEKLKKREENVQVSGLLKKWYKPKDDLELEDQKKLPSTIPVQTIVPQQHFGEVLMLLEFVDTFSDLLSSKDFFPNGFNLELVQRALVEKEIAGPFIDIIQMFLNALFKVQDEEASQYVTTSENVRDVDVEYSEHLSLTEAARLATAASNYCAKCQGTPLGKLPLYSLTVSEVLRLHFLTSGARIIDNGAKWRFQERGGYHNTDDPGLYLRINEPHILRSLATHNIVELSLESKLTIVTCLINQLLTYADVRDTIDDRIERNKQAKIDYKVTVCAERKRRQQFVCARSAVKKDKELTNKNIVDELDRLNKENAEKTAEHMELLSKLMQESFDRQVILGYDRAFRRYIKSQSIPGIFIENQEDNSGYCQKEITKQNPNLIDASRQNIAEHIRKLNEGMNSSDKENNPEESTQKLNGMHDADVETFNELYMCSADENTCIVHSSSACTTRWSFIHKQQQLDQLVKALNIRGIRESDLKQVLQSDYEVISKIVSQTPGHILNPSIEEEEPQAAKVNGKSNFETNFGFPSDADPSEVQQSILVENILELEDKIFAANLGCIKVIDRSQWRDALTKKDYDAFETTAKLKNEIKMEDEDGSRPSTPEFGVNNLKDPGEYLPTTQTDETAELAFEKSTRKTIQLLALALFQISQGVSSKYLKKPLGNIGKRKEDAKKDIDVFERWQQSLLASTSFSQIFLHYATLDGCIMWSRSILLARCRICRSQKDSEDMLLCDGCNLGHHIYCLKPKLMSLPKGDYFCTKCLQEKEKETKLLSPDTKKKRKIFRDDVDDDDSNEENPNETEDSDDDMDTEESDAIKVELCTTCGSGGELIFCDQCSNSYHIECVQPPLRRPPGRKWLCNGCTEKKREKGEKDETKSGIVAQQTFVVNNQRRCAARARHKIRGFVKSLRRMSESEDSFYGSPEVIPVSRRSQRREADIREDLPLHNASLHELLSDIMKHKDAWPFIRPVQKNEVPDYYEIIEKPMDFGTIKYKLNMGEYRCDADLMADVVLVFENCNTYNNSDADVYKCGVKLLRHFEKKSRELGLKLPEEMQEMNDDSPRSKKRRTK